MSQKSTDNARQSSPVRLSRDCLLERHRVVTLSVGNDKNDLSHLDISELGASGAFGAEPDDDRRGVRRYAKSERAALPAVRGLAGVPGASREDIEPTTAGVVSGHVHPLGPLQFRVVVREPDDVGLTRLEPSRLEDDIGRRSLGSRRIVTPSRLLPGIRVQCSRSARVACTRACVGGGRMLSRVASAVARALKVDRETTWGEWNALPHRRSASVAASGSREPGADSALRAIVIPVNRWTSRPSSEIPPGGP
jgi:hypothetical protein